MNGKDGHQIQDGGFIRRMGKRLGGLNYNKLHLKRIKTKDQVRSCSNNLGKNGEADLR